MLFISNSILINTIHNEIIAVRTVLYQVSLIIQDKILLLQKCRFRDLSSYFYKRELKYVIVPGLVKFLQSQVKQSPQRSLESVSAKPLAHFRENTSYHSNWI